MGPNYSLNTDRRGVVCATIMPSRPQRPRSSSVSPVKYVLRFGGGALTFFGGIGILSLVIFLSQIAQLPASDQLLSAASLLGPALVTSAICAASFWLGLVRLGHRPKTGNPYLLGVLCALV